MLVHEISHHMLHFGPWGRQKQECNGNNDQSTLRPDAGKHHARTRLPRDGCLATGREQKAETPRPATSGKPEAEEPMLCAGSWTSYTTRPRSLREPRVANNERHEVQRKPRLAQRATRQGHRA